MIQINGVILTDRFANAAFFLLQVNAAFIDICDQRNGLSKIDMDGLIFRDLLIKLIRVFDRTVFNTGRTPRAFALDDIPGLFDQGDPEVPRFPLDTVNFSVGQNLYIGMPADLDQFGGKYSDGAVIGGKGLVKLCHMAANGRCLVDQVNLKTRSGKIQRGLDTADPSTDNHDVSKTNVSETLIKLLRLFFFHLSMSLRKGLHRFQKTDYRDFKRRSHRFFNRCHRSVIAVISLNHFLENLRDVLNLYDFTLLQR